MTALLGTLRPGKVTGPYYDINLKASRGSQYKRSLLVIGYKPNGLVFEIYIGYVKRRDAPGADYYVTMQVEIVFWSSEYESDVTLFFAAHKLYFMQHGETTGIPWRRRDL